MDGRMGNAVQGFYVYIVTDRERKELVTGTTGDLSGRLTRLKADQIVCRLLLYYERFDTPAEAMSRQKKLTRWSRRKKADLINCLNPEWQSLNDRFQ